MAQAASVRELHMVENLDSRYYTPGENACMKARARVKVGGKGFLAVQ